MEPSASSPTPAWPARQARDRAPQEACSALAEGGRAERGRPRRHHVARTPPMTRPHPWASVWRRARQPANRRARASGSSQRRARGLWRGPPTNPRTRLQRRRCTRFLVVRGEQSRRDPGRAQGWRRGPKRGLGPRNPHRQRSPCTGRSPPRPRRWDRAASRSDRGRSGHRGRCAPRRGPSPNGATGDGTRRG